MTIERLAQSGAIQEGVLLHRLTTYKLGGPARWFFEPRSVAELVAATPIDVPVLVVGRGSNLVVADEGFDGLVVHLGASFAHRRFERDAVVAGAACPLPTLARDAAREGRAGLEWMVGIPGSVGGAVRMNAGCFGFDTAESLVSAQVVDLSTGDVLTRDAAGLDLTYRHSNITAVQVVVEATFRTKPGLRHESEQKMREITRWRREHQPGGTLNAGSVFRNPPGDSAGAIIDRLGLKGHRVGGASVSEKHANFFVADRTATASDVHSLVHDVRDRVLKATGVELQPEITFAGFS